MATFSLQLLQLVAFFAAAATAGLHLQQRAAASSFCATVDSAIPGTISYTGNAVFASSLSSYYSAQERAIQPSCIFTPTATAQVSKFIKLTVAHGSPHFAIRAGGHMLFPGAANIDGGVTVDMRSMDSYSLSADKKIASVGGGAIWSNVYPYLDAHQVTIVGARVPGIAVGGFATGGGINFQARKHGWACDNVVGYEVVLASGEVVYATSDQHRDLWLALKGGSNNFGIVTRFDFGTVPQGLMWGGVMAYNFTQANLDAQAKAFADYMLPENFDEAADMGIIMGYVSGQFVLENSLFYLDPTPYPPVYQGFTSIPSLFNTLSITNVSNLVSQFGKVLPVTVPRITELVFALKPGDAALYSQLFQTWQDSVAPIANVSGLQLQYLVQPQPVSNGTNSLGGVPGSKNVLALVTAVYNNAADDTAVFNAIQNVVNVQETLIAQKGLSLPFKYLNYADPSQDPISSYGVLEKLRLQMTSKKYDPRGLFQTSVPGGFKLFT